MVGRRGNCKKLASLKIVQGPFKLIFLNYLKECVLKKLYYLKSLYSFYKSISYINIRAANQNYKS